MTSDWFPLSLPACLKRIVDAAIEASLFSLPRKVKKIIDGREVEFNALGTHESFDSDDIPPSLLDESVL